MISDDFVPEEQLKIGPSKSFNDRDLLTRKAPEPRRDDRKYSTALFSAVPSGLERQRRRPGVKTPGYFRSSLRDFTFDIQCPFECPKLRARRLAFDVQRFGNVRCSMFPLPLLHSSFYLLPSKSLSPSHERRQCFQLSTTIHSRAHSAAMGKLFRAQKHEGPTSKLQRSSKLQIPDRTSRALLAAWCLEFLWSLVLGCWRFSS